VRAEKSYATKCGDDCREILIRRLEQAGLKHIFGVPGDYVLKFFDLLEASEIQSGMHVQRAECRVCRGCLCAPPPPGGGLRYLRRRRVQRSERCSRGLRRTGRRWS